ncbi:MAG TPA: isopentenyl-diphosphate Delta-isomerase [Chitinophagales bacterium]|nr:isopentenyl-diphosphate Delta-isomerase [Chitinophagales bacterium]
MTDDVILVDENDNRIGAMSKEEAHREGKLHRAFSVLIFNSAGEMLLQRRALDKYHSGGLWTNACCSHPRVDETNVDAAKRRLKEEIGLVTDLTHVYEFVYNAKFENGLVEHEYDHVFHGVTDNAPVANAQEVVDWKYISIAELSKDMSLRPEAYTAWFKILMNDLNTNAPELLTPTRMLKRA